MCLCVCLSVCLTACGVAEAGDGFTEMGNNPQTSGSVDDNYGEEDSNLKREFCVVDSLHENCFVLRNTEGECYRIDNSFLQNFKVGDEVLLIYFERKQLEDGVFEVSVKAVYPDNSTLVIPS